MNLMQGEDFLLRNITHYQIEQYGIMHTFLRTIPILTAPNLLLEVHSDEGRTRLLYMVGIVRCTC